MSDNLTQWEHFKQNYVGTSMFLLALFLLVLTLELVRGSSEWWIAFVFLGLAIIVLPLGNYISWKKKYK